MCSSCFVGFMELASSDVLPLRRCHQVNLWVIFFEPLDHGPNLAGRFNGVRIGGTLVRLHKNMAGVALAGGSFEGGSEKAARVLRLQVSRNSRKCLRQRAKLVGVSRALHRLHDRT